MKITHDIIKALKPCQDRFENFTNNYPTYSDSTANFLSLENISYEDKIWVIGRLMSRSGNAKWAIACANSVLPIFERACPKDMRPRELLEYMSSFSDFAKTSNEDLDKLKVMRNQIGVNYENEYATGNVAKAVQAACSAICAIAAYVDVPGTKHFPDAYLSMYTAAGYAADAAFAQNKHATYEYAVKAKKAQQDLNLQLLFGVL